jgi:hypothetical protein
MKRCPPTAGASLRLSGAPSYTRMGEIRASADLSHPHADAGSRLMKCSAQTAGAS